KNGQYCEETFLKNALKPEVKAIEIKLGQGAKVRGGKLPKEKITQEIAEIRGIEMGKDVESPNRFTLFSDLDGLFKLITHWQTITGKPVGIKVIAGDNHSFDELAKHMKETDENRTSSLLMEQKGELELLIKRWPTASVYRFILAS